MKRQKISVNIFLIVVLVVLIIYAISLIVLFGWGVLSSFKDPLRDFRKNP